MRVITVDNIAKKYKLGFIRKEDTLRDKLVHQFKTLFKPNKNNIATEVKESKNDFWALRDISFNIDQGEVVGIIGRNGAGKSTLLKILSRITDPTEGEIKISGRVASLLEVGTGFHPELSGRENIFMNGSILGMSKEEITGKFDEIVEFAEIEKFIDTPVKRYSSGMYVRLAFAIAAHLEPEILIVDEVLAVGDIEFQKKCLGKMQDVSKSGRTVLFVSHNMQAIRALVSRCILIHKGKLEYQGQTEDCITRYMNMHVKDDSITSISFPENNPTIRVPVVIKNIRLLSQEIGETNIFHLGETLSIEINLESIRSGEKIQIDIEIHNEEGFKLYHLVMTDSGIHALEFDSSRSMIAKISLDNMKIYPGKYYISIYVGSAGKGRQNYAYLQSAIVFFMSYETDQNISNLVRQESPIIHDLSKSKAVIFEAAKWEVIK